MYMISLKQAIYFNLQYIYQDLTNSGMAFEDSSAE
jgi:hypothetical protein